MRVGELIKYIGKKIPELYEGETGRKITKVNGSSDRYDLHSRFNYWIESSGRDLRLHFSGNMMDLNTVVRELQAYQKNAPMIKGKVSFPILHERDRRILERVTLGEGDDEFYMRARLRLKGEERRLPGNKDYITGAVFRSAFLPVVRSLIRHKLIH